MFKTRKEYIDLIKKLQDESFPKLKKCWGHNVWFIIQIQIGFYFHFVFNKKINLNDKQHCNKSIFEGRLTFSDFRRFLKSIYYLLCNYKKWQKKWNNTTMLFGYKSHNIEKDGHSYNIYLEPYQAVLKEQGIKSEILYVDDLGKVYELYIRLYYIQFFFHKLKSKFLVKQFNNIKYNSDLVGEFFKNMNLDSEYITSNIANAIILNELYYKIYRCMLKLLSPQKIWTYCYYTRMGGNSFIRAANSLNIESAEYQHSAISDGHFAYSKWNFIDAYLEFFPKSFFVWNEYDKELIYRNFSGKFYVPKVIVSGNFYAEQELQQNTNRLEINQNKDILICLQGLWLPKFVEEAIIKSSHVKWYFRLHPRYPEDKEKLISFASSYPDRVEIEKANNLTLYELFENVGIVLTMFSGTAREAKEFGLRVIIVGREGYNSYKNYIDDGVFDYAENEDRLLNLIQSK